ncbi:MAG: hypothetical protein LBV55_04230 [Acholeplasmatales bacterium]|jgi:hypothetical protein|nr:hypothetical protein [Acholeplasmatales bacterium]
MKIASYLLLSLAIVLLLGNIGLIIVVNLTAYQFSMKWFLALLFSGLTILILSIIMLILLKKNSTKKS